MPPSWRDRYDEQALLTWHRDFAVCAAGHWLWLDHRGAATARRPAALTQASDRLAPASFWMARGA